jgi:hypothetical protein
VGIALSNQMIDPVRFTLVSGEQQLRSPEPGGRHYLQAGS